LVPLWQLFERYSLNDNKLINNNSYWLNFIFNCKRAKVSCLKIFLFQSNFYISRHFHS